jgi:hypothetical protein
VKNWRSSLWYAAPIVAFVLGLFYFWFAIADRYHIFLYNHLGTTPFDEMTRSRYWMSGLVAAGAVMMGYILVNWFLGRLAGLRYRAYTPPAWWRVWLWCFVPLVAGIPVITLTCNNPTLPPIDALACLGATLIGLALALWPGSIAARQPGELVWLTLAGAGLLPSLLLLRAVELPGRGLSVSPTLAYGVALGANLAGVIWLALLSWVQLKLHYHLEAKKLLLAGCCLGYLLLPLVHHVLFTPPEFRYISSASNFFAFNPLIQGVSWVAAVVLAGGITQLQQRVLSSKKRSPS